MSASATPEPVIRQIVEAMRTLAGPHPGSPLNERSHRLRAQNLQLRCDGPTINVTSPVVVNRSAGLSRSWDEQFRNALCGQIGKSVRTVEVVGQLHLLIAFDDGSEISISLVPDDYSGPEAAYYHGFDKAEWGVI